MADAGAQVTSQAARKQRNDRLVRRWTTATTTLAFGLASALTGLATVAPARGSAVVHTEPQGASADAVLAAAIADYAAAAASRQAARITPARSHPQLAAAPPPAPSRPRAVAVSGGS